MSCEFFGTKNLGPDVAELEDQVADNNLGQRIRAVISLVDGTVAPPSTNDGDRFIIISLGGSPDSGWGAEIELNGVMQYVAADSGFRIKKSPGLGTLEEGMKAYVDSLNSDVRYIDDGAPTWETIPSGSVDLGTTPTASNVTVTNTAGTDAVIGSNTPSNSGVFRPVNTLSNKSSLVSADLLYLEDSEDSNNKKRTTVGDVSLFPTSSIIDLSDASESIDSSTYKSSWTRLTLNGSQNLTISNAEGWTANQELIMSSIGTGLKRLIAGTGVTFNVVDNLGTTVVAASFRVTKSVRIKALSATVFDIVDLDVSKNIARAYTAKQYFAEFTIPGGPAYIWDLAIAQTAAITLIANSTITVTGMSPGLTPMLRVIQGGVGSFTLGYSAAFVSSDDNTIAFTKTLSTSIASYTTMAFYSNGLQMAGAT